MRDRTECTVSDCPGWCAGLGPVPATAGYEAGQHTTVNIVNQIAVLQSVIRVTYGAP